MFKDINFYNSVENIIVKTLLKNDKSATEKLELITQKISNKAYYYHKKRKKI